jgi:type II secretory ATPase GspE/PulE/Tfp pilus assembly ATPase PilB-like protein
VIWAAAIENGTQPLIKNAWEKVGEGLTTVEEVFSKVSERI